MAEQWRPVRGVPLYEVSSLGRVRSVEHRQRYEHWRSRAEMFRRVPARIIAQQLQNSGYSIVHLWQDNQRIARTVHRLVAEAFCTGRPAATVNHKDGNKQNNKASNLEWATYSENHRHAVATGLNRCAIAVQCPDTGERFPSINEAARQRGICHHTVRKRFARCQP